MKVNPMRKQQCFTPSRACLKVNDGSMLDAIGLYVCKYNICESTRSNLSNEN